MTKIPRCQVDIGYHWQKREERKNAELRSRDRDRDEWIMMITEFVRRGIRFREILS